MVVVFLNTLPMMGGSTFHLRARAPLGRRINDKDTYRATTVSIGLKCGTHLGPVRRRLLCDPFGTKRWPSTNGGRRLHRHLFLNNVFFVFLILVNRSNTSFGIVSKLGGLGDGPPTLCMNFAGSGPAITTILIGLKPYSEKKFLNGMGR